MGYWNGKDFLKKLSPMGGSLVLALPLNIFDHIPGKGWRKRLQLHFTSVSNFF